MICRCLRLGVLILVGVLCQVRELGGEELIFMIPKSTGHVKSLLNIKHSFVSVLILSKSRSNFCDFQFSYSFLRAIAYRTGAHLTRQK